MACTHLLVVIAVACCVTTLAGRLRLALVAPWASSAEWGVEREVNVLLRVKTHNVRWNVDKLLAHTDVTVADEHTRVVHRLGESELEDLRLQTALL